MSYALNLGSGYMPAGMRMQDGDEPDECLDCGCVECICDVGFCEECGQPHEDCACEEGDDEVDHLLDDYGPRWGDND